MNKSLTHTPAEWTLEGQGIVENPLTRGTIYTQKIETRQGTIEIIDGTNEEEGNAYLIAAAPKLLAACKGMMEILNDLRSAIDMHPDRRKIRNAVEQAIKEAEGEKAL